MVQMEEIYSNFFQVSEPNILSCFWKTNDGSMVKPILKLHHLFKQAVKILNALCPIQMFINILKGVFRQRFGFAG